MAMFIMVINSEDPKEVSNILKEQSEYIEKHKNKYGATGQNFEYEFLPEQPFKYLSEILKFNSDGNTLIEK